MTEILKRNLSALVFLMVLGANAISAEEVEFRGPFGIGVKADGSFYVAQMRTSGSSVNMYNPKWKLEDKPTGARISKFDAVGNRIGEINYIEGYGYLKGPFDVDVSVGGNIYIADTGGCSVLVLDSNEKLILKLGVGKASAKPGGLHDPHFVTPNEKLGLIYVSDTFNNRVQIFDMKGDLLKILGGKSSYTEPGSYHFCGGTASDEQGNVYAMNWSGCYINIYNSKWELEGTFGERGAKPVQFHDAYSIMIDDNTIWVVDTFNNRLQQFSKDRKLIKIIGGTEGAGTNQFNHPTDMDFDGQGNMYIADWKNDRVVKLSPNGEFLKSWGGAAVAMRYKPPKVYRRELSDGPVTMGIDGSISKTGIDLASTSGLDWIHVSFSNQGGEWNIKKQVDYAHEKGIKVIAKLAIYHMGVDLEMWKKRPEMFMWQKGAAGPSTQALSYFYPEVRSWKAKHIAEQVKKSGIDGLMLDYIRYPNSISGYEPAMVATFKKETGKDPAQIPADDWDWLKFRSKYITLFISELRYELAQLDRPVTLGVKVNPNWQDDLRSTMRDWRDWTKMGIVDTLALGIYSRDFSSFYDGIRKTIQNCPKHIKVCIVIACYGGNLNTPELLKKGADVCFAAGVDRLGIYRGDVIDRLKLWKTIGEISTQYKK